MQTRETRAKAERKTACECWTAALLWRRRMRRNVFQLVAVSVVAACSAAAVGVGPADAITPKVAYGKPGPVQLLPIEGSRVVNEDPRIAFPQHVVQRSAAARKDRQRICTALQIWAPATPPATGWVLSASSPTWCAWTNPGDRIRVNRYYFEGTFGVEYHAEFFVSWATKKRKKLARATYDFNNVNDYKCMTRFCFIDQAADVPYISFSS
jgi:hypothetical protein